MNVKQHPLMEVIARKLSGIESVPRKAQARMVLAACRAARKWHEAEIERRNNDLPHLHAPDGVRGTIRAMLLPDHHGLPV
jgi:hypothetical protein